MRFMRIPTLDRIIMDFIIYIPIEYVHNYIFKTLPIYKSYGMFGVIIVLEIIKLFKSRYNKHFQKKKKPFQHNTV